ncbi:MAG: type IV toxin-antitoxin system AbiEi family antitoxin domain-containing protein [Atribacterota bacterium]
MKYNILKKINKNYFTYQDIARTLSISNDSARVLASRYVKQDYLIRLKNNYYIFKEKWDRLNHIEKMKIANIIQVPSYISLMTALSYYEITTQVQQNYFESISIFRSFSKEVNDVTFNYSKIKNQYYFGFKKDNGIFIASAEKALVDALYLTNLGKYSLDLSSIDLEKIEKNKIDRILQIYSNNFTNYINRIFK